MGGDVMTINISARSGMGIDELEKAVLPTPYTLYIYIYICICI